MFPFVFAMVAGSVRAAAPWGTPLMQPGIGVVTCAAPSTMATSNAFVMAYLDFRNPPSGSYGPFGPSSPLWNPPAYHHPAWTAETIGAVYGLAIDAKGDVYTAAHGLYSKTWIYSYYHRYGNLGGGSNSLAAAGTIYRINRTNGVPTVFTVVPQQSMSLGAGWNSGPGWGNLAYDPAFDQFFATSLEDGKIYRINNAGAVVQTFDPLSPDSGAPGLPPLSDLLWGIGVNRGAVHYAVWNTGGVPAPGKIRRLNLDGTGAMVPSSDTEVLVVPASPLAIGSPGGWAASVPVTDLAFSADGNRMLLGERTMLGLTDSYNHCSRIHIAQWSGTNWVVTRTLETGNSWGRGEAYGGVAYGEENGAPEQIIWGTSADLAGGPGPHGIQGVRPGDFPLAGSPSIVTNAFRVPFDPAYTTAGPDFKGSGGDVEIMPAQPCSAVKVVSVECPEKPDAPISVVIDITNLSGVTVNYGWFTPCPTNLLPAGAITLQPLPSSVFPLPGPVTNNGIATVTLQLPAAASGQTVCFRLTLLNETGEVCCTEKICVDVPNCECARLVDSKIDCQVQADGTVQYTLTLVVQNLTHLSSNPFPFHHATFLPPTGFLPANATPVPNPIPPGGTGTFTAVYTGLPGPLCFHLTLHDENIDPCCSIPVCLELPPCDGASHPDTCAVDEKVPCKPNDDGTPGGTAIITYTVCNNSTVPRTYSWNASGLPATPPCTQVLAPADFLPSSGTLGPVPPGGCATVSIAVRCNDFKPDDCARFQVCATPGPEIDPVCCEGVVYRPKPDHPVITLAPDPAAGVPTVPVGSAITLPLLIANPQDLEIATTVVLRDEFNVLGFASAAGGPAQITYTERFSLAAGADRSLRLQASRFDLGQNPPPFTRLQAWARTGNVILSEIGLEPPDLVVAVRLPKWKDGGGSPNRPTIQSLRISDDATPHAILTMTTESGARYRIERTPSLQALWGTALAEIRECPVDDEGVFVGTGGAVTCEVPCETGETAMFFRIVRVD